MTLVDRMVIYYHCIRANGLYYASGFGEVGSTYAWALRHCRKIAQHTGYEFDKVRDDILYCDGTHTYEVMMNHLRKIGYPLPTKEEAYRFDENRRTPEYREFREKIKFRYTERMV